MKNTKSITVFTLTMINLATILSIRNWPMTAEYGLASIFFVVMAMIFFFVPAALVSAELASNFPQKGGVFVWVKEAMGHRLGFLAIWLLWVENIVYYPAILSFTTATIAYIFSPTIGSNPWYTFIMIQVIFWAITLVNLKGMKMSGWISTIGVILGTIIPAALIIGLGITWISSERPSHIDFSWSNLFPKLNGVSDLAFFAGIIVSFCGIEMSAVHINDVENPKRSYPKAILFSASLIFLFTVLGALSISIVIPGGEINLLAGSIEALYIFLDAFNLNWFVPVLALLVAIGSISTVSTWTAGPCRGLLAAGEKGDFPPFMQKHNKHDMPSTLMIMQAVIVTLLSSLYVFMPSVNSSFWILTVLIAHLYLIMYILMFVSGIILRYKNVAVHGTFRIPFGNVGMWIAASLGIIGSIFAIVIGFIPPSQIPTGKILNFEIIVVAGIVLFCLPPFIIYQMKKPSWVVKE